MDKHLRRLAAELTVWNCTEVTIELGISSKELDTLEYQYNHKNPDDLKFSALKRWVDKTSNASFEELKKAVVKSGGNEHMLCRVILLK